MTPAAGGLRLAAAQAGSVPGDIAANVATAVSLVTAAADQEARVVVLPELFLTGYDEAAWVHDASISLDDDVLAPVVEVARSRAVVVLVGAAVRRAHDPTTRSVVLKTPHGEVDPPHHNPLRGVFFFCQKKHGSFDVASLKLCFTS